MKILWNLTLILLACSSIKAQKISPKPQIQTLSEYNQARVRTSRNGMFVLGSWAVGNMLVSGLSILNSSGKERFFHVGNVSWNAVNLAIVIPSLIGSYRANDAEFDYKKSIKSQKSIETVYLVNFGLDFAYVGAGIGLYEYARRNPSYKFNAQFNGFGKSLILQGAFLMLFDAGMYTVHHVHGESLKNIPEFSYTGNGVRMKYSF